MDEWDRQQRGGHEPVPAEKGEVQASSARSEGGSDNGVEQPRQAEPEQRSRDQLETMEERELGESELRNQLKLLSADLENFRRRSELQILEAGKRGQDRFLAELVPVLVDLQAALSQPAGNDAEGLRTGIAMVLDKLLTRLEGLGYTRIPARGQSMDPLRFEALFTVPSSTHPPGTVLDELAPGFERDSRVVLPAKVSVARGE
ncbi:MAG: nucleotide exchange factor GrpE [Deltaproteobacteria bacterium]|nr:nucleotide exchange factor GrpE [Deltaproteobacteria bacterium]